MKRNLFAALTLAFAVVVEASGAIFLDGKVCELSPRGNGDAGFGFTGSRNLLAHRPEGIARAWFKRDPNAAF